MSAERIPFIHFMVRVGDGRESYLLGASEVEEGGVGGEFVAPLTEDGGLFPAYQFHYSLYLGNGKYFPDGEGKKLFHGSGLTLPTEGHGHLLLSFGAMDGECWPMPEVWAPPYLWGPPRALRSRGQFLLPVLRRVLRRPPLRYGGKSKHKDFRHPFAELEAADPKLFERLLDEFHISIIGFSPNGTQREA